MLEEESQAGKLLVLGTLKLTYSMTFVGEDLELVGFAEFDELLDEFKSIANVDIFIKQSVDEEQAVGLRGQVGSVVEDRALFVASGVVGGRVHVALSVGSVVGLPLSDRCTRDGNLEEIGSLSEAEECHISTIRPSGNSDALRINNARFDEMRQPIDLLLNFDGTHGISQVSFESQATTPRTNSIYDDNQITEVRI